MSSGRHAFQTCICSLIGFNSFFVLYLMCCFGNNPLYITGNYGVNKDGDRVRSQEISAHIYYESL
jgi:hypothetical protein